MMSNALGSISWMQMMLVTSAMGPVSMARNTGEWEHSAPELTSTRSVNGSCPIWGNYQQLCEPDVQNPDCIQEMWCPCFLRQPCCFPDFINWPESDFQFDYSFNKDLQNLPKLRVLTYLAYYRLDQSNYWFTVLCSSHYMFQCFFSSRYSLVV